MRTTLVRVEQDEADPAEVDRIVNAAIRKIEDAGERVHDVRVAVGRDADKSSGIAKRFCVTYVLLHGTK